MTESVSFFDLLDSLFRSAERVVGQPRQAMPKNRKELWCRT
jgi:hypothetical protein